MVNDTNNYAFIDGQNLYLATKKNGWPLDYYKFRVYLKEKYGVNKAYLFLGFNAANQDLYKKLQEQGYIIVFRPTLIYKDGKTKGNCDAELVLQAMIDFNEYEKAVIITGDGDFHCLIKYLVKMEKLKKLLIPRQASYSALLKKFDSGYISFISDLQKLEYKKRTQ